MTDLTLKISGMSCNNCVKAIDKALKSLKGVETAVVSLADKTAIIKYDDKALTEQDIINCIDDTGFEAVK